MYNIILGVLNPCLISTNIDKGVKYFDIILTKKLEVGSEGEKTGTRGCGEAGAGSEKWSGAWHSARVSVCRVPACALHIQRESQNNCIPLEVHRSPQIQVPLPFIT